MGKDDRNRVTRIIAAVRPSEGWRTGASTRSRTRIQTGWRSISLNGCRARDLGGSPAPSGASTRSRGVVSPGAVGRITYKVIRAWARTLGPSGASVRGSRVSKTHATSPTNWPRFSRPPVRAT